MLQVIAVVLALTGVIRCVPVANQSAIGHFGCTYWYEDGKLACGEAGKEVITCDAVCEWGIHGQACKPAEFKYKVFGIGELYNDTANSSADFFAKEEPSRYHLYPRGRNGTIYINHTIQVDDQDKPVDLILYEGDKFVFSGLRVFNETCYGNLVSLFNTTVTTLEPVGWRDSKFNLIGNISFVAGQMVNATHGRVVFADFDRYVLF